jgi:hypothetical protein
MADGSFPSKPRTISSPAKEYLMKGAHPYLNLPGTTEEAFTFYRSVFGGDFVALIRFGVQWMVDYTGNADTSWMWTA